MKLRQAAIVGGSMTGMLVLGAGPAFAAYPPNTGTGTVSRSNVKQGQTVAFCGTGFASKVAVRVSVGGVYYQTVRSNPNGRFCAAVRLYRVGRTTLAGNGMDDNDSRYTVVALVVVSSKHRGGRGGHGHDPRHDLPSGGNGAGTQSLELVSAATGSTGGMPLTAAETAALVSGSLLLLGAGTGFRVAGRRRRSLVG